MLKQLLPFAFQNMVNLNQGPSGGHQLGGDLCPPSIWEGPIKIHRHMFHVPLVLKGIYH